MDIVPAIGWHLRKIPKVIYLYWGRNQPLSWMRYMTVYSLSVLNRDWKIKIYYPIKTSFSITWVSSSYRHVDYKGKDYFDDLRIKLAPT